MDLGRRINEAHTYSLLSAATTINEKAQRPPGGVATSMPLWLWAQAGRGRRRGEGGQRRVYESTQLVRIAGDKTREQ